jgi:hypothetical protein
LARTIDAEPLSSDAEVRDGAVAFFETLGRIRRLAGLGQARDAVLLLWRDLTDEAERRAV